MNFYKLLGVHPTATARQIKAAYHRLSRECHPDIAKKGKADAARFTLLTEAYNVLCDPAKRREYDRSNIRSGPGIPGPIREAGARLGEQVVVELEGAAQKGVLSLAQWIRQRLGLP